MSESKRKSHSSLRIILVTALFACFSLYVLLEDLDENNVDYVDISPRHLMMREDETDDPDPSPWSPLDLTPAIPRAAFSADTCQSFGISPIVQPNPDAPKYIVFYPRAGMGNVLMGYVSSVIYACLTGRVLKIAPYHLRETGEFKCPEYFDANAGVDSICHGLEMDHQLMLKYTSSSTEVKRPEAWMPEHCPKNKRHMEYFLCDDGFSDDEFIAIYSCHYFGDLFYDNPFFKPRLSPTTFRDVLRSTISPSVAVKEKMVDDGPYQVCVHVRWDVMETAGSLGSDWIDNLGTCVRNILSRQNDDGTAKKEVLLFTMHEGVRNAVKGSFEGDVPVRFASEATRAAEGGGGHSADKQQGIADMFSLGQQCINILPTAEHSTYLIMAANLMDNVSVFPGKQWKDGCLEGTQVTDMTPISDYWNTPSDDICELGETMCKVKDGSATVELKPPLRFYEKKSNPSFS